MYFLQIWQLGSSDAGAAGGGSLAAQNHSGWHHKMREDCQESEGKGQMTCPVGAGEDGKEKGEDE